MVFEPHLIHIGSALTAMGDTIQLTDHISMPSYVCGQKTFNVDEGIDYDVVLTHAGEGILVSGMLHATISTECDRCLDPATYHIASEVQGFYLFEEPHDLADDEDEYLLVTSDLDIDLAPALEAALTIETPFVALCREDCKGLCPSCGANLNYESCTCDRSSQVDEDHPFAALAQLNLSE